MENSFSYQPAADRYEQMPYTYCGKSGLQLPLISLGLWHNFGSVDNFNVATDMIKYAFDHGVTHFDLANNYGPEPGSAEENFGRILKTDLQTYRDELIIVQKLAMICGKDRMEAGAAETFDCKSGTESKEIRM